MEIIHNFNFIYLIKITVALQNTAAFSYSMNLNERKKGTKVDRDILNLMRIIGIL